MSAPEEPVSEEPWGEDGVITKQTPAVNEKVYLDPKVLVGPSYRLRWEMGLLGQKKAPQKKLYGRSVSQTPLRHSSESWNPSAHNTFTDNVDSSFRWNDASVRLSFAPTGPGATLRPEGRGVPLDVGFAESLKITG